MDNEKLKISIITINLNNRDGLRKTVASALGQSYQNIEYIIIDGGSTDGSLDVIHENSTKLSYWVSELDTGIYNAFNKGIERSTGEYILFLNSGDYLVDIAVVSGFFACAPCEDIVYGDIYLKDHGNLKLLKYPEVMDINFLYQRSLAHQSTFIKRELFKLYGNYCEQFEIVSDWMFMLYLYLNTHCTFRKIEMVVSVFNNDGVSSERGHRDLHMDERDRVKNDLIPYPMRLVAAFGVKYDLPVNRLFKLMLYVKNIMKVN